MKKGKAASSTSEILLEDFEWMHLIRQFELRGEAAYQQGLIGGFYHAYIGQEAIQTAAVRVMGREQWWTTSYRCHALALLLGVTPNEAMAELFGRVTGNALGRGGSMHLYTSRMLGGHGIVGGQIPVATGSAFTLKYQGDKERLAICFLGEGAVAQGAFHESLNLAALWDLPILYVIENNEWGMGTAVHRAISVSPIAELKSASFGMKGKTIDGMDYFQLIDEFQEISQYVIGQQKPFLLEIKTQRFKGHSISDPGLYRSKESLAACLQRDPLILMQNELLSRQVATEEQLEAVIEKAKARVVAALAFAADSPWPDPACLEEGVMAMKGEK